MPSAKFVSTNRKITGPKNLQILTLGERFNKLLQCPVPFDLSHEGLSATYRAVWSLLMLKCIGINRFITDILYEIVQPHSVNKARRTIM